ncbi:MAG: Phosphocholine transferase AnkX [bacterium ADurb.Bin429]|nr:MAG: Phosphocholine transferase AnkX [bacterium ADurb.Bin429]
MRWILVALLAGWGALAGAVQAPDSFVTRGVTYLSVEPMARWLAPEMQVSVTKTPPSVTLKSDGRTLRITFPVPRGQAIPTPETLTVGDAKLPAWESAFTAKLNDAAIPLDPPALWLERGLFLPARFVAAQYALRLAPHPGGRYVTLSHPRDASMLTIYYRAEDVARVRQALAAAGKGDTVALAHLLDRCPYLLPATDAVALPLLAHAAQGGSVKAVQLLLARGADPDAGGWGGYTPLVVGIKHEEVVRALLKAGADPNTRDAFYIGSPLHAAVVTGNLNVVVMLLQARANPNVRGRVDGATGAFTDVTPLQLAIHLNRRDLAELLLAHNADPNGAGSTDPSPLCFAATFGDLAMVKTLVAYGANPRLPSSQAKGTPLDAAVWAGKLDIARYFLDQGADVNARAADGRTPLFSAVLGRRAEILALLLEKGATVNAVNGQGATPLHYAWNADSARALLARGAIVNAVAHNGLTPLMAAAWSSATDSPALVALFIEKGADVHARFTGPTHTGRTALHFAVMSKSLPKVKLLVEHGAQVNAKAKDGSTAISLAKSLGAEEIARYLRAKGAR